MKIKLDENVATSLCGVFEERSVETDTVFSEGLQGSEDELLFKKTHSEDRLLVTCDLDFADIRRFPPSEAGGIVVLRLSSRSSRSVVDRIKEVLNAVSLSELRGATTIVSDDRIRIRR